MTNGWNTKHRPISAFIRSTQKVQNSYLLLSAVKTLVSVFVLWIADICSADTARVFSLVTEKRVLVSYTQRLDEATKPKCRCIGASCSTKKNDSLMQMPSTFSQSRGALFLRVINMIINMCCPDCNCICLPHH